MVGIRGVARRNSRPHLNLEWMDMKNVARGLLLAAVTLGSAGTACAEGIFLELAAGAPFGGSGWRFADGSTAKPSSGVLVRPGVGYQINDSWAVMVSSVQVKASQNGTTEKLQAVPVQAVYTFVDLGKVAYFGKFGLSFLKGELKPGAATFGASDLSFSDVGLALGAGARMKLTKQVSAVAGLDYGPGVRYTGSDGSRFDLSQTHVYLGMQVGF